LLISAISNPIPDKKINFFINCEQISRNISVQFLISRFSLKMIKFVGLIFLLALSSANAFWSVCLDRPGVSPTRVESPFCSGTLCTVGRGQTLTADAWVTFVGAHSRLDVRLTAYILGIGVTLPSDPPNDNGMVIMIMILIISSLDLSFFQLAIRFLI
jgi:hypothetical protein